MNELPASDKAPPRWLERFLLLVLKRRDRETVCGDLLEEYREVILPGRGPFRANLWFLRQSVSLIGNVQFGLGIGVALGGFNLIATMVSPLAEDTPARVAAFFGGVLLLWGLSGFAAEKRTGRWLESAKAGAKVGLISIALFHVAVILRVNLFLDTVSQRSDWHGLLMNFHQSGFESLRAFANYTYLKATGFVLPVGLVAGTVSGLMGGLLAVVSRRVTRVSHGS
jgi:hypothetical protein